MSAAKKDDNEPRGAGAITDEPQVPTPIDIVDKKTGAIAYRRGTYVPLSVAQEHKLTEPDPERLKEEQGAVPTSSSEPAGASASSKD